MTNKDIPFPELMEAVLNQLKSRKYMDSTLALYRRFYNRMYVFLKQHGTDVYTHELGKSFLSGTNVGRSALSAYACAVRRLDDCMEGKPYRFHHAVFCMQPPFVFSSVLARYIQDCADAGNTPSTLRTKERTCTVFLDFLEKAGCSDLSQLDTGMISRALLAFSNKDSCTFVRQFLKYLAVRGFVKTDFSGIVPRCRRRKTLPTTYSPDEIRRVESAIDLSTDTGKRNLAIIRLASRMGLRSGDIAGLKLSEISFSTGYISITQEKTGIPLSADAARGVQCPAGAS